jgi:hypothetical protein
MTRGPVPKRSDQRRRRNKPEVEAEKVKTSGAVRRPAASKNWHPIARGWYESLGRSAQSRFYEPSDWHSARLVADIMSRISQGDGVSSAEVAAMSKLMSELLVTEGSRRRVRLEIERAAEAVKAPAGVTAIDEYRRRLGS